MYYNYMSLHSTIVYVQYPDRIAVHEDFGCTQVSESELQNSSVFFSYSMSQCNVTSHNVA